MTITKSNLTDTITNQVGLSKSKSIQALETTIETIKSTLESDEPVMISGFGKFQIKNKAERKGRNPATGNDLTLDARRVVAFKCSGVLRERLNGRKQR